MDPFMLMSAVNAVICFGLGLVIGAMGVGLFWYRAENRRLRDGKL